MNDLRQRIIASGVAVAASLALVAAGNVPTASKASAPFQACQALLEHFPVDVAGDHGRPLGGGLFELLNPDCTTQVTHGPDPGKATPPEDVSGLSSTNTTTLQAAGKSVCATDNAFELIYAIPSGTSDTYATNAPKWADAIDKADGKLNLEAQAIMGSSAQSHYKVVCNSDGTTKVNKVFMSAGNNATFSTITTELRNKGFGSNNRKYWVYWAGSTSSGFSGQGSSTNDSSDSSGNAAMSGNMFAINYNNFDWLTAMHEAGHNLGAVQNDSPDSSGGHHCDGTESTGGVMCYNDGGSTWDNVQACGNPPSQTYGGTLDWCDNDYWAPNHRSDSTYIGTHWNIAECATGPSGGKWLVATWCGWVPPNPTPTPTPTATATATTTPPATQAVYDAALGAPKCATVQVLCDTGASLVKGKDTLSGGIEQNQPNTVDSCTDGTTTDSGYGVDESVESVKVATTDGTAFAAGKTTRVTVSAYIYSTTDDRLDVWYSPTATTPTWTLAATLTPGGTGLQTLTATYTLPSGGTQAVRASLRWQGSAIPCTTSNYDDPDDLAFASGTGPTPTPTPTTTATPTPTPTATGTFACNNGTDDDGDGKVDAADAECWGTDDPNAGGSWTQAPYYKPTWTSESEHRAWFWSYTLDYPTCSGTSFKSYGTHNHDAECTPPAGYP